MPQSKEYLKKITATILEWPSNSSDFKPRENLWNYVKNKIADKQPANVKALVDAIKEVWITGMSAENCQFHTQHTSLY